MTDEQDGAPQETSGKSFDPFAKLRQGGFGEPQIQAWKSDADQRLKAAGFDDDKIGEFWNQYQVQPPKPPALPPQPAMPYYARALTGNAEERDIEDPFGARNRVRVGGAPQGEDFQMAARVIAQGAEPIATTVEEKLRKLYDSRGMHPAEVATDAQGNLRLMQSLVSKGADEAEHYDVRPGWGMLSKAEQEQEVKQRIAAGRKIGEQTIPMLERALAAAQSGPIPADVIAEMRASPYGASTGMMSVSSLEGALASARNKVAEADAFEKGSHAPITQTAWRSTPRALAAGALGSVASLGEGVGMARGWIGHWRAGHEIDDESIQQWIRSAKDWAAEMFPADQGRQNDILEHTASTLGMISGLYGARGVAQLAGAGAKGQAWAMGVAGAIGQGAMGHEEGVAAMKAPPVITEPTGAPEFAAAGGGIATGEPQESRPISHGAVLAGTIGQTAVGAAMALPFAKMATRGLPHETRLGRALIGAGEQAAMFPAFGVAGNLVSRETYDPSRQLFTDFWQSMGVGTAVGFITGMAAKGMPTPRRAIEYTSAELQGMLAEHPAMVEEYKKLAKAVIADDFMPPLDPKVRNDLVYVLDSVDPELANQLHDHQLPGEPRGPLAPVPEAAPHLQELERRLNETVQGFVAGVPVRVFEGEARPGEDARFSFAGWNEKDVPQDVIDMDKANVSPELIWAKKGFLKDRYGKWQDELNDSKMRILDQNVINNGFNGKLGDLIEHQELFDRFPDARNIDVSVVTHERSGLAGSEYDPSSNSIRINPGIPGELPIRSDLAHEIQHWLQGRTGLEGGGSQQSASAQNALAKYEISRQLEKISETGLGHNIGPLLKQALSAIERADEHVSGSWGGLAYTDAQWESYRRLRGEIQARQAEQRLDLSEEERLAQYPPAHQDVPPEHELAAGQPISVSYENEELRRRVIGDAYDEITAKTPFAIVDPEYADRNDKYAYLAHDSISIKPAGYVGSFHQMLKFYRKDFVDSMVVHGVVPVLDEINKHASAIPEEIASVSRSLENYGSILKEIKDRVRDPDALVDSMSVKRKTLNDRVHELSGSRVWGSRWGENDAVASDELNEAESKLAEFFSSPEFLDADKYETSKRNVNVASRRIKELTGKYQDLQTAREIGEQALKSGGAEVAERPEFEMHELNPEGLIERQDVSGFDPEQLDAAIERLAPKIEALYEKEFPDQYYEDWESHGWHALGTGKSGHEDKDVLKRVEELYPAEVSEYKRLFQADEYAKLRRALDPSNRIMYSFGGKEAKEAPLGRQAEAEKMLGRGMTREPETPPPPPPTEEAAKPTAAPTEAKAPAEPQQPDPGLIHKDPGEALKKAEEIVKGWDAVDASPIPPPVTEEAAGIIQQAIKDMLPEHYKVHILDHIPGPGGREASGMHHAASALIAITSKHSSLAAISIGWHETIHALRQLNLFSPAEWRALTAAAKAGKFLSEDASARYRAHLDSAKVHFETPDGHATYANEIMDQEHVAFMAAEWAKGHSFGPAIDTLLARAMDFLRRVKEKFSKAPAINTVMERIAKGEVAARYKGPIEGKLDGHAMAKGRAVDTARRLEASKPKASIDEAMYSFGGKEAKEAPLGRQAEAEKMLGRGMTREQVWEETGWLKDAQGKWQFEIDDSKAEFKPLEMKQDSQDPNRSWDHAFLRDILQHDDLFRHYPELMDIPVQITLDKSFNKDEGIGQAFEGLDEKADYVRYILVEADSQGRALTALLHEIQHFIQKREKFALGGSVEDLGLEQQRNLPGEIQARNVEARQKLSTEERRVKYPWKTQDVPGSEEISLQAKPYSFGPMYAMGQDIVEQGQRYSFGGEGAKHAPSGREAAEMMAAEGLPRELIREETGWHRGATGRWRFEIDDSQAELNEGVLGDGSRPYSGTLGEVLSHGKLFEHYPDLKNVPVEIAVGDKWVTRGLVLEKDGDIQKILVAQSTLQQVRSTLIHEIQHAIQVSEGEKLVQGVPVEKWNEIVREVKKKFDPDILNKYGNELDKAIRYSIYYLSKHELEARLSASRLELGEEERKTSHPFITKEALDVESKLQGLTGDELARANIVHEIVKEKLGRETFDETLYKRYLESDEYKDRVSAKRAELNSKLEKARVEQAAKEEEERDARAKRKARFEAAEKARIEKAEADRRAEAARLAAEEAAKADKEALRLEGRLKSEQAEIDRLSVEYAAARAEQDRLEHEQAEAERRVNDADAAIAKARADIEQAKAIITEAGQDFARLDAEIQEARKALQEMADQEEVDISPAPGQQVEPLAPIATLPARRPGKPIIEGYFDPKARTIWVSAAALDPELVVREEAAHAIKSLGLYTPDEWAQLTVEARDNGWIDAMPNRELYEQKYGHLSPELLADALADEAVAKAFAGWRKGEIEVKGWVAQLFQRLANLLDRTGNWLKGQGFNTADDVGRLYGYQSSEQVFRAIEAGEFRRRQGELALREGSDVSRETGGAAGAGGPPAIPPTGAPPSRGFAPTPPPGGYTPQQIANARASVLSRLSIGDPEKRQRFGAEQFYKNFLDKQYYVGKAVVTATGQRASGQEGLPTEVNPYHLIRMAPGISGKIDHFIMDGTFDFNTHEVTGEGLQPILDLIRGSAVDFSAFLASARNMELAARGIATGIDVGASRIYGSSQTDRFAEPATRLYAWKDASLAYLRDSGIISAESYDRIKAANKFHVAFHAVFDPEEQRMMISSTAQGGGVQPRNPVHVIKGSERRKIDPLESAIKDAAIFIKQAENNAITRSLVDMLMGFHAEAEAAATEGRAERVGEPAGAIERQPIDVEATAPIAEGLPGAQPRIGETRAGLPAPVELLPSDIAPEARAAAEEFLRNNGVDGAPPELVDWVAAEAAGPLPAGQVAVYRNGRREIYRVDPELAEAIKGLNKESLGLIEKMMAIPAGTLRAGAVLTPQFGIRHLLRSFEYAFITGKGFFSPVDTARGVFAILGHSERYREWLRSGGANVAMVGLDRDYLQERLTDMADYGLFTRTWNLVTDPERSAFTKAGAVLGLPVQTAQRYIMHPLRVWIEMSENAQHVGAFMKERRRQERAGETAQIGQKAAIQRAGWESRETGVDIRRMGASMHAFNMITAFSNIVLQDTDRVARAFVADPISTLFRVGIAITAPSVLLWIANHDQKWYKNAEDWEKDIFWMINTGTDDDENAVIWRIPKPFSAGVMFGTGAERALSAYFDGNKDELEKFITGLHETSMPRLIPTAVSPLLEHWGNRSFFFNKNVVNKSQEMMLPEYQFTEYTTETAKAVARAISAIPGMREMALSKAASGHFMAQAMTSPIIMENYLRGWTGTLGMWALKTVDQAGFATGVYDRKLLPAATLADYPVIGSFVHRHPSAKAQNIQDFYDRYEVNTAYITTWRNLAKAGDALEAERVRQLGGDAALVRLDTTMNALHAQHQLVGAVIRDKQMQPSDKRQLIDQIYRAMSFTADQGNAMMDMIEDQIKSQVRH